ncbi:MAG: hypothetical protein RL030_1779 [Pseudomonadota bacterium]|jgi:hypothetical protein
MKLDDVMGGAMGGQPSPAAPQNGVPYEIQQERLNDFGRYVSKLRDEAVRAREESGIESTWQECEEAYLGIDDENRSEFQGARWAKPMTMDGVLVGARRANSSDEVRATAFVRLTSRYVNAGAAKVKEITLPIDGKPFTLKATPVPEMAAATEDDRPAQEVTGQPMPGPDGQPVSVADLAKHQVQKAEDAAEKAADRIYDWLVEGKHTAHMRKVIDDMARLGVGVLKGPVPRDCRATVVTKMPDGGVKVEFISQIKPATQWVDPWCFYPAPGCGEDVHKGGHCLEVVPMLAAELIELSEQDGMYYLPEQIDKVVKEGPGKTYGQGVRNPQVTPHKKEFDVWHFYGSVPRAAFEAANAAQSDEIDDDRDRVFAVVTMVNDTVIRAVLNPMESGRLPYHVASWKRRAGHWAGVGVAEEVRTPQRIVTAATRAMLDNAGKSAGAQVVMDPNVVEPSDNNLRITGRDKLWWIKSGQATEDVRKVFAAFNWPNTTPQLMTVIEYGFKLAEEQSSIPLITQGQSGDTTPDTFSGQQLQDNNANQLLRDIGFSLNDQITTPLIDQFYERLLLDPDVPNDEKGDYQVDTSGALAVVEKALGDIFVIQLLTASVNPAYGLSPERCMEEAIRTKRMNPSLFMLTETEKEAKAKQPPPKAPAVEAAEVRAQASVEIAKSSDALTAQRIKTDTDRDTAYVQAETNRDAANAQARAGELQLKARIAELTYQTKVAEFALATHLNENDAKVKLATTAMELRTQAALAGHPEDAPGAPQVAPTPMEPVGRAPDGQAFQK